MTEERSPIPINSGPESPGSEAGSDSAGRVEAPRQPPGPCQTPLIDIHEGPDGLVLEADLPGATEAGLVVQVEENVLTLQAMTEPGVDPAARLIHQEYQPGPFARSFILSDEVDRTRISATLKDGVLRIDLPRSERARTRRIEVKSP